ncbi:MAG: metal-sulfur cluster assembly factor [Candidatus Limnocylindrales bacterium]
MTDTASSTEPGFAPAQPVEAGRAPSQPAVPSQPLPSEPPDGGQPAGALQASGSAPVATPVPPPFDAERRATELAILDSLRSVVDPEIGMNVVELALIKQIVLGPERTEVKMILTTPFCPYAGVMIQQVKEATEQVVANEVKITLLAERWDPRDAGLTW